MSEELFENTQPEEAVQEVNNPYIQAADHTTNPQGESNAYNQLPGYDRNPYTQQGYAQSTQNPQAQQGYAQNSYMQQGYTQNTQNAYMQQGYSQNAQNPYMQQGYTANVQNPYIQQPQKRPKGNGTGFGVASLVLGIVSVFLFGCCVNYITAILAIVFAVVQMVKNRQKGMAIAGIVTACVSIILGTLMWVGVSKNLGDTNVDDLYDEFYEYYENEYPLNNSVDEL